MVDLTVTVWPMKCPECGLRKDFGSEQAREDYLRPHAEKCVDLKRRWHEEEGGEVAKELIAFIKEGSGIAPGEFPPEMFKGSKK